MGSRAYIVVGPALGLAAVSVKMNDLVDWRRKLAAACIFLALAGCTMPDVRVRPGTQTGTHKGRDAGPSGLADASAAAAGRRAAGGSDAGPTPTVKAASASGSAGKQSEADGGQPSGASTSSAGEAGSAGSGKPAATSDEDAGPGAIATVLQEYEAFLSAQKEAVGIICSCWHEHRFPHRMACEASFGLFQPGKTTCVEAIVRREAVHAIPRMQCRRNVFESYRDCVASEFECSPPEQDDAGILPGCLALLDRGNELCPPSPDWLLAQFDVCYDLAEDYWAYVDVVYAQASRVCGCFSALGYDSLEACLQGEGIVYREFAPLETCFFELEGKQGSNPDEKASASAYFACDQMRMTEYATCVAAASTCDMSAALQCKNIYRIERAGCRNQAHFLRDPYELCGQ